MDRDPDIGARLPQPPPPAPARRAAAIEAAMRRYDGEPASPAAAREPVRRPATWLSRPQLGLAASALLVALIGAPAAWMSLRHPAAVQQAPPPPASPARAAPPATVAKGPAAADTSAIADNGQAAAAAPGSEAKACPGCTAVERSMLADAAPAEPPPPGAPAAKSQDQPSANADYASAPPAPAPPAPPPPPPAPPAEAELPMLARRAPQQRMAAPVVVGGLADSARQDRAATEESANIVVTGAKRSRSNASERGDWNACTVDDPRRALARCRGEIAGAAAVGEGLSRAWNGDLDAAIGAFDRAIAQAPRSSLAYLNRGLALQRRGELDRAIADFDRAVRFAPSSARAYYVRSQALRQRGDARRADRDLRRAIDLDPDYRATPD